MGRSNLIKRAAELFGDIGKRRIGTFAAAATFYLFISLVPFLLILCSLLPLTHISAADAIKAVSGIMPGSMKELVRSIIENIYEGNQATLSVSIVLAIWSTSLSMTAIMRGMSAVYDVTRRENYIVLRLRAAVLMVALILATVSSIAVVVYGYELVELLCGTVPLFARLHRLESMLHIGRYVFSCAFLNLVFLLIYRVTPGARLRIRDQWVGALFSAVAWVLFSAGYSAYVDFSDKYGIYGAVGTVFVAMLWLYYCIYFLLIGGYFNSRYISKTGDKK